MRKYRFIIIALCFFVLFFCLGQQGCEMPGFDKTEARKYGLDYSLISGVDYLSGGKVIQQGETFYVGIHIENYDSIPRTGEVCISDNVADTYGGISSQGSGECKSFYVSAADVVRKETTGITGKRIVEQVNPGKTDVYFPVAGMYSYYGLPSSAQPWKQVLYVSVRYLETSRVTGTVTVPYPSQEQISLVQEPSPIFVSATKSIHRFSNGYKVDLAISLQKKQPVKIYYDGQENVTYFAARLEPQILQCFLTSGQPVTDKIIIENERLIKCSSLVYLSGEAQQAYPLVITLNYGVSIDKQYSFGIRTQ